MGIEGTETREERLLRATDIMRALVRTRVAAAFQTEDLLQDAYAHVIDRVGRSYDPSRSNLSSFVYMIYPQWRHRHMERQERRFDAEMPASPLPNDGEGDLDFESPITHAVDPHWENGYREVESEVAIEQLLQLVSRRRDRVIARMYYEWGMTSTEIAPYFEGRCEGQPLTASGIRCILDRARKEMRAALEAA